MQTSQQQTYCDGRLFRRLFLAAHAWLHHNHQRVNAMNVFPVPDGDTGTNMLLTIQRAVKEIEAYPIANIGLVSERLAQGALMGARGNSGTILSMLLRGFAMQLEGHSRMDTALFRQALQSSVEYAYTTIRAVMEPVEGTILTVAREAANAAPDDEPDLRRMLQHIVSAAQISLANTPELLPILKEAGVVDSGGMGLTIMLEGMLRWLDGETMPVIATDEPIGQPVGFGHDGSSSLASVLQPMDEEGYGYDVQFLMRGEALDLKRIRTDIAAMGWSPLVDGNETLVKVHIHVHNPGIPISYAIEQGASLDDIVVENMQLQSVAYIQSRTQSHSTHRSNDNLAPLPTIAPEIRNLNIAIIAVANGEGLREIFMQYGAQAVILGGQTMNPSADDFLKEIEHLDTNEIIILPNNRNIIMTAQQVTHMVQGKDVRVVATKSIPQGINALLAYGDASEDDVLDQVIVMMDERVQYTVSAEITIATRAVKIGDLLVNEGDYIGLQDGKIVVADSTLEPIVTKLVAYIVSQSTSPPIELVTMYTGKAVSTALSVQIQHGLAQQFPDVEFEMLEGGQPLYPFIMSFE